MTSYAERMATLDTAIRDYAADVDQDPTIVTGWVLYVAGTPVESDGDPDSDTTSYMTARPPGQAYHSTLGLLNSAIQDFTRLQQ